MTPLLSGGYYTVPLDSLGIPPVVVLHRVMGVIRGDVKIRWSRPSNTTASQGWPMVRGPEPLILSWPFTASQLL